MEALQLLQVDRVERALVLYLITAWRIAQLMRLRQDLARPEQDASLIFHANEIKGAYSLAQRARPANAPTLNQRIRLIASLGGFLGQKSGSEPGAKTIWLGLQRPGDAASGPSNEDACRV